MSSKAGDGAGFRALELADAEGGQVTGGSSSSSVGFHSAACQPALSGILKDGSPGQTWERELSASRDVLVEASLQAVQLALWES